MQITHLISDLSPINFGVWNAALSTSGIFAEKYACATGIWSTGNPDLKSINQEYPSIPVKLMNGGVGMDGGISIRDNIFISHGSWTWATKTGYALKREGFKWMAVPHGMLEPWSMNHKKWKKKVYFSLYEKRMLKKADTIIAVGGPEYENLKKIFGEKVVRIPNGIKPYNGDIEKDNTKSIFLFLGRLHEKKGVLPLVKGWFESGLAKNDNAELWIAGPDEGELEKIKEECAKKGARSKEQGGRNSEQGAEGKGQRGSTISGSDSPTSNFQLLTSILYPPASNLYPLTSNLQLLAPNIKYLGPVYNQQKEAILKQARFFMLPSQSEGFPTSIIEAMTYGCIPIITEGCNFPEAIDHEVAFKTTFDAGGIATSLRKALNLSLENAVVLSARTKNFADSRFHLEKIAGMQLSLYKDLLKG